MKTTLVVWGVASALLVASTPFVANHFGGLKRYLYCLFVFSLQLAINVNVIYRADPKRAGVNGVRVTPTLLLAATLLIVSIFNRADTRRRPMVASGSWIWASGAFLAASTLSAVNTPVKAWTAFGLASG